jgi:hypothetical protein
MINNKRKGFNKMLVLTVKLENCSQCHHIDHSGSFTPGGDKLICAHPEASVCVEIFKNINDGWYWKNRIVNKFCFPNWCPLQNGYKY